MKFWDLFEVGNSLNLKIFPFVEKILIVTLVNRVFFGCLLIFLKLIIIL